MKNIETIKYYHELLQVIGDGLMLTFLIIMIISALTRLIRAFIKEKKEKDGQH